MEVLPNLPRWAALSAGSGVLSHLLYFIRGEHHRQAVKLAQLTFVIPTILFIALIRVGNFNFAEASLTTATLAGSYAFSLWTSMLIYRIVFHRLGSFPGPPLMKLSKFFHIMQLGGLDNYKRLDKWHNKYGDFVRIGPNELSIVDPDAVEAIMGARSACTKAPWYDGGLPLISMHQSRDRAEHDKRRRVWDRGFSIKALEGYESQVKGFADLLVDQVKSFSGKPLNASLWFNYYSFDVMGQLAFGQSFDMLKSGEKHSAIKMLCEGQMPLGILGPMPWLIMIITKIPGLGSAYMRWVSYCEEQAEKRKQMKVEERDIMSWLLEAEPMSADPERERMWLVGDARLIIVAGSDTTAAALTYLFYHIAHDPSCADKLRDELRPLMKEDGTFDGKDLANADYLNGMINETLRMHPPVPSGVSRLTPPEGIQIGKTYVPGDTTVAVPLWTMGRSQKAWKRPDEFIPERWFSQPDLIIRKDAYAPFSVGRYGCIGKNLALMEVRIVAALLCTKFNVSFASGENGHKLVHETEDYFTLGLADLMLQFTPRK